MRVKLLGKEYQSKVFFQSHLHQNNFCGAPPGFVFRIIYACCRLALSIIYVKFSTNPLIIGILLRTIFGFCNIVEVNLSLFPLFCQNNEKKLGVYPCKSFSEIQFSIEGRIGSIIPRLPKKIYYQ